MKRIELAAATMLEHARFYLAGLPIADQNMAIDPVTNMLTNHAIPVLFFAETAIKLENSQY